MKICEFSNYCMHASDTVCGGNADSDFNNYVNKRAPQQTKRLLNMVSQQIITKAQVFANKNAYDSLNLFRAFILEW